jgi:hypothetical protein
VTFHLADWQRTAPEFALYAVITGLFALAVLAVAAKVERLTRSPRAAWMARRSDALRSGETSMSAVLPIAWIGIVALALAQWGHVLRSGGVS